ncbi:MAG: hypothetical protein ABJZ55_12250 [Fuerstiella sp.]
MTAAEFRTDIWTGRSVIVAGDRANRPQTVSKPRDHSVDSQISGDRFESELDPFLEGREHNTPAERLALRQDGTSSDERGWLLRIVENRFPAVTSLTDSSPASAKGVHDVVIECPDFRRCWLQFSVFEVARVLTAWQLRVSQLASIPELKSIQVFRNQGAAAGASLGHSHSQIISLTTVPKLCEQRFQNSGGFFEWRAAEISNGQRIVCATDLLIVCPDASWVKGQIRLCPTEGSAVWDVPFYQLPSEALLVLSQMLQTCIRVVRKTLPQASFNMVLNLPPIIHPNGFPWSIDIMPRTASFAGFELSCDIPIITMPPETAAAEYRSAWNECKIELDEIQDMSSGICPPDFSWQQA